MLLKRQCFFYFDFLAFFFDFLRFWLDFGRPRAVKKLKKNSKKSEKIDWKNASK